MAALDRAVDQNADLVLLQELPGKKGRIGISHPEDEIRKQKKV
jgi:hypothetical protein